MKFSFLILLLFVGASKGVGGVCDPAPYPLEVVFLIDRSSRSVLGQLPKIIQMVDPIHYQYKMVSFGISHFSDFACSNFFQPHQCAEWILEDGQHHHENPEGCYTFSSSLSSDLNLAKENVQEGKIEPLPSGYGESGTAALMMTATDPKIKWTNESTKVIIVVTDAPTHNIAIWEDKRSVKGDGTDKCSTMSSPSPEFVGDVLGRKSISVFLILSNNALPWGNTFDIWKEVMEKMKIRYAIANMSDSPDLIFEKFETFMNYIRLL